MILLFLFFISTKFTQCASEPIGTIEPPVTVTKNSELFELLMKVASGGTNVFEEIVCLDFIYPLNLIVYDSNYHYLAVRTIFGDEDFINFLENLGDGESISLSYPIQTTFSDGSVFSVNNNEELKLALESCSKEDIIAYCNANFKPLPICVYAVKYGEDLNNKYISGFFSATPNGTLTFSFNDEIYQCTWVYLYINDVLHININLLGNTSVTQDWNINRPILLGENDFTIVNGTKNIVLEKICQRSESYEVGAEGPAGGFIFYDKGAYSDGWRYMEVAPEDLALFQWGCFNSSIDGAQNNTIGKGLYTTAQIVNHHDNLINYYSNPGQCDSQNNGTVAAKKAFQFELNGYKRWFLPTSEELLLLYNTLAPLEIANLEGNYWSSTEVNETTVKTLNVENGDLQEQIKVADSIRTRLIRYF